MGWVGATNCTNGAVVLRRQGVLGASQRGSGIVTTMALEGEKQRIEAAKRARAAGACNDLVLLVIFSRREQLHTGCRQAERIVQNEY